jgi:glycosyltransferase involved in cell wall biosynthesis
MRDRVSDDVSLVVKVQNGQSRSRDYQEFRDEVGAISDNVTLIDETLTADDMVTLISLCDAYLSLHRSEGFGLGMAEAMNLGRPLVCTGWSGNMDFCDERSAQLVDYQLIPVQPGEYPCHEGQVWADADVDDAADKMAELVDNPDLYAEKSLEGRIKMRTDFSYLATGLRYARRIKEILSDQDGARAQSGKKTDKARRMKDLEEENGYLGPDTG